MLQTRSSILLVAVTNTAAGGDVVVITNSAGWIVYTIDSGARGTSVSAVASTVGTVTLLASNTTRRAASIYNESTQPLYMKLGASATTANYTLMIVGSGYYEVPAPIYTGIITGIWKTSNGQALVSETT